MRRSWTAILLASLACGESRDSVAPLTILPAGVNLAPGGRRQFTASEVVSWSVAGTDAGAIDSGGLYTAPAVSGTFQVVATSADKARIASATVTVSLGTAVSISIDPTNATLAPGAAQLFTTTVTGSQDRTVIWSVREPAGGAMADGLYTAPQRGGVFHVVAASHADPSKIAVATVAVGDPPARVSISIDPTAAALRAGESVRFFASGSYTSDQGAIREMNGQQSRRARLPEILPAVRFEASLATEAGIRFLHAMSGKIAWEMAMRPVRALFGRST